MAKKVIVKKQTNTKKQENNKNQIKKTAKPFSLVGFITGIVSVSTFWTGIVGLPTGIVSIVFSAMSKKNKQPTEKDAKHAKQGLAMGIAGTVLSAICLVAWVVFFSWILWKYIIW